MFLSDLKEDQTNPWSALLQYRHITVPKRGAVRRAVRHSPGLSQVVRSSTMGVVLEPVVWKTTSRSSPAPRQDVASAALVLFPVDLALGVAFVEDVESAISA